MYKKVMFSLLLLLATIIITGCVPTAVVESQDPFDVREGGKSKVLWAPEVVVLEDLSATMTCQGRPEAVRILSADGTVLVPRIPVSSAVPTPNGWSITLPLFEGLNAYFIPGTTYRVNCMGPNGTDGTYATVKAYYFWTQAEADGYARP